MRMLRRLFSLLLLACYLSTLSVSKAKDTLGPGQFLDLSSGDFLESSNKRYQLSRDGEYSLVIKYVYMNHSLTVWDANGDVKSFNVLVSANMSDDGRFLVYEKAHVISYILNAEQLVKIPNTTATLLDNGNLVLRAEKRGIVWQSFDFPRATWMLGMKLKYLGGYLDSPQQMLKFDPNQKSQLVGENSFGDFYWRSGTWNKGFPSLNIDQIMATHGIDFTFSYFTNENESYFIWNSSDPFAQIMLVDPGKIRIYSGDFSVNQTVVDCQSKNANLSMGCACGGKEEIFTERSDASIMWDMDADYFSSDLSYCQQKCTANCSCNAYASISSAHCRFSGSNQIVVGSNPKGETLFLRDGISWNRDQLALAPGPAPMQALDPFPGRHSRKWIRFLPAPIAALLVLLTLGFSFCCLQRRYGCLQALGRLSILERQKLSDRDEDSLLFSFASIEIATNNFSNENKLGQGGYGPVYKGKLPNGQEIAVKRLQRISGHGIEQFKNEVKVISNLQHRNLVKLLGYCTDRDERLLVYEYLSNNSLDSILFNPEKKESLDWKLRLHIIDGISQGLLYLHKYSRLKIIHRDLKTSNILLDNDLNPKISDFGTAKIFGDNESRANTNRIVGTYGYMSPEYAMDGIFSVKSDVFSFGVVILEIICGKKNAAFYDSDRHINLLGYVWDLWTERRVSEIPDPNLVGTIPIDHLERYVQVGLLCVQENAADRPTMPNVVSMLNNERISLPTPKQPSFAAITNLNNANLGEIIEPDSLNKLTISELEGR